MTILITGATGLVGPRVLARLTAAGGGCRALVRPGKGVLAGVERVEGGRADGLAPGAEAQRRPSRRCRDGVSPWLSPVRSTDAS